MPIAINLGSADTYAVLAGTAVNNTATNTVLTGNLGIYPGGILMNFPPGVISGLTNIANAASQQAIASLLIAYDQAVFTDPIDAILTELGGKTLIPGVYGFETTATLTGTLTLDAQGDLSSTAVWVFKVGSDLTTAGNSIIKLVNGAKGKNVFWQITGSAFLGNNSIFIGTIMALINITVGTLATAQGGLLVRDGIVSLDDNPLVQSHFNNTATGGDPHVICLDGSRIDVYNPGYYRLFDNCDTNGNRIVINADVRRDEKTNDYYDKIWIQINENKKIMEYTLNFKSDGISINGFDQLVPRWEHNYTTLDNIRYIFTCESKYNSVFLSTNDSTGPIKYAGLMAGVITPLVSLEDTSITQFRMIQPNYYQRNAIVVSSAGPQVISVQKRALHPHTGWFRLLQWTTLISVGIMNVLFDDKGRARKLTINATRGNQVINDEWEWIGEKHWKLCALKNKMQVAEAYCQEYNFFLGEDAFILVRVQGNGSISASFRKTKEYARGVFFEDILRVINGDDLKICAIYRPLTQNYESPETAILYQRMIDAIAA
jgi:hypothetical protein